MLKDAAIFSAAVAQTPARTIHSDLLSNVQHLLSVLKFLTATTSVIPWHTKEVTTGQHLGKYEVQFLETDPVLAETTWKPSFGQSLGKEERKRNEPVIYSVSHHGWVDVCHRTAVPLSLKLNYPCDFTRRIRMAEQIRAEKRDKLRLVKKRWKTGNNPIWLKRLKASDRKAGGIFFSESTAPFLPTSNKWTLCPFSDRNHPPLVSTLRKQKEAVRHKGGAIWLLPPM